MATLEPIAYTPHRCVVVEGHVEWAPVKNSKAIEGLPQIIWRDGTPWREANLWALERATSRDTKLATVQSDATALHAYASWLEQVGRDWWDFPPKKADRCLVRYRGALIDARESGEIAPSTTSQRMAAVV